MSMKISLIVAMAQNRVIGADNAMPWHLPADLRHFKAVTLGKPVVMGRRTFESIGRPLPGRRNLVITRDPTWQADGVEVAGSLEQALAAVAGCDEVMIIGGGQLYAQALDLADCLYLTHIDLAVAGDTRFPPYEQLGWQCIAAEAHEPDEKNPYPYRFETLIRLRD